MMEEEFKKFSEENLNRFQQRFSYYNESVEIFYYAYIKLLDGKKILFFNQNGKSLFRTKNTLTTQIRSYLFYDGESNWETSDKDKRRFIEEHTEIFKITFPYEKN